MMSVGYRYYVFEDRNSSALRLLGLVLTHNVRLDAFSTFIISPYWT